MCDLLQFATALIELLLTMLRGSENVPQRKLVFTNEKLRDKIYISETLVYFRF